MNNVHVCRVGICLVALSETPHNGVWRTTKDTIVDIGTVVRDSPLHRYATIMLRAAVLLGVNGVSCKATAAKVAAAMTSSTAAAAATTDKCELDWGVLKTCALRKGELHPVGHPHIDSDRPLWVLWSDVPETYRTGFDYITPRQKQILHTVRERSAVAAKAKLNALWKQFQRHVHSHYSKGYRHTLIHNANADQTNTHCSPDPPPYLSRIGASAAVCGTPS